MCLCRRLKTVLINYSYIIIYKNETVNIIREMYIMLML